MKVSTLIQLKAQARKLNSLIAKFPTVRSLVRKWVFELVLVEGRIEDLEAQQPEPPKQLTIWDIKPMSLEIIHRKSYEYREQIKAMGCKWNPSKKAWVAPSEEVWEQVSQMLENTDDIRSSCSGRQGLSEMTSEGIDDFPNDKIESQPQQTQSISYTPTMSDALKLFGEERINRYWDERIPSEASKILASRETDESEIFDRLNYDGMKGKSIDLLIDLVNHFRQNPPNKPESEFKYIELVSCRNKGINAYLCPVINGKADYNQADYGKPINEEEQDKAHRSKKHTVKVRYDNLSDGLYQWKEAGGADNNKSRYGWMKIVKGECVAEGEGYPPRG